MLPRGKQNLSVPLKQASGRREQPPRSLLGKRRVKDCLLALRAAFLSALCRTSVWEQPPLPKGSGTLQRSAKLEGSYCSVTGNVELLLNVLL